MSEELLINLSREALVVFLQVAGPMLLLGLLAGMVFDTPQQMGLWLVVPLLVLVAGVVADMIVDRVPPVVATLVGLLPTAAGSEMMRLAVVGDASLADAVPQLGIIAAWTLVSLSAGVARLRRTDR